MKLKPIFLRCKIFVAVQYFRCPSRAILPKDRLGRYIYRPFFCFQPFNADIFTTAASENVTNSDPKPIPLVQCRKIAFYNHELGSTRFTRGRCNWR